jgi:hypothetical protein
MKLQKSPGAKYLLQDFLSQQQENKAPQPWSVIISFSGNRQKRFLA